MKAIVITIIIMLGFCHLAFSLKKTNSTQKFCLKIINIISNTLQSTMKIRRIESILKAKAQDASKSKALNKVILLLNISVNCINLGDGTSGKIS